MRRFNVTLFVAITGGVGAAMAVALHDWGVGLALGAGIGAALAFGASCRPGGDSQ